MTRSEFIDDITSWSELLEFCSEESCDLLDDIFDEESMDSEINEFLGDYARDYDWYNLRDYLKEIPTGYDYYQQNGAFDWVGLTDDDLDNYKNDVLRWAEDYDVFEDEDDEGDDGIDNEEPEEPEDPPVEDEDFPFDELFGLCAQTCSSIQEVNRYQEEAEYAEFENFVKRG